MIARGVDNAKPRNRIKDVMQADGDLVSLISKHPG